MLHELGVGPDHEAVKGGLALIRKACREDARIGLAPRAPLYPCYTRGGCPNDVSMGLTGHDVLHRSVSNIIESVHESGGWRCNFTKFGRGTETEFSFLRYNLFFYVYVLSFYRRAKRDRRFDDALAALESKLNKEGQVIVERPHRSLEGLEFCSMGQPSDPGTARNREIRQNLQA